MVIGKLDKNELVRIFDTVKNKHFKIIVEMSIKGSNAEEFGIITKPKKKMLKHGINGTLKHAKKWSTFTQKYQM